MPGIVGKNISAPWTETQIKAGRLDWFNRDEPKDHSGADV